MSSAQGDITGLLHKWSQGDRAAGDEIAPVIYSELRRMAKRRLSREPAGHSWQSADLVHEAYLQMVGQRNANWNDRAHFFAVCATMMRRILVDHARAQHRKKRGGGVSTLVLNEAIDLPQERPYELIALDDALNTLAELDPQQSRIVELRFFTGLSLEETAEALNISKATVSRHWVTARAWLIRELSRGN